MNTKIIVLCYICRYQPPALENNYTIDSKLLKNYNKIRSREKRKYLCLAPFSTIFFTEFGEILPCYYNKNIVFGKYPQDNPLDAWFGDKMENLREHIRNNDLWYGCQDCHQYIARNNFYSTGAWKYDYLPINTGKYPLSLDFQISNICNLSCIMCNGEYSKTVRQLREKKDGYVNPYDDKFIEKIKPFIPHLKEAAFTGGEVFLIKMYYDIWDAIIELNPKVRISITTNGTILNSRVKEYLEKLDFNITISLDSVRKENFEQIRRFSDFGKFMENLDYFIDYTRRKNTFFTVKICPMRQNRHELPDIIRFLNEKDVYLQFNNVVFPPYCSLWNLPSRELDVLIGFLNLQKYDVTTHIQKENMNRVENLVLQIKNWHKDAAEFEAKYPDIGSKTADDLYTMLVTSINFYLSSSSMIQNTSFHGMNYEKMFADVMDIVKDKAVLKNAFLYYFRMPVSRLVGEFNIRNMDKIVERTIQSGQLTPPEPEK